MRSTVIRILALSLIFIGTMAQAAPVPEDQRMDLDLRRTTLVVHDMDASLAFYRDALGMVVTYDNMLRTPQDAKTNEEADSATHLVFLRANDDFVGIPVLSSILIDPDGHVVELNDLLIDPEEM